MELLERYGFSFKGKFLIVFWFCLMVICSQAFSNEEQETHLSSIRYENSSLYCQSDFSKCSSTEKTCDDLGDQNTADSVSWYFSSFFLSLIVPPVAVEYAVSSFESYLKSYQPVSRMETLIISLLKFADLAFSYPIRKGPAVKIFEYTENVIQRNVETKLWGVDPAFDKYNQAFSEVRNTEENVFSEGQIYEREIISLINQIILDLLESANCELNSEIMGDNLVARNIAFIAHLFFMIVPELDGSERSFRRSFDMFWSKCRTIKDRRSLNKLIIGEIENLNPMFSILPDVCNRYMILLNNFQIHPRQKKSSNFFSCSKPSVSIAQRGLTKFERRSSITTVSGLCAVFLFNTYLNKEGHLENFMNLNIQSYGQYLLISKSKEISANVFKQLVSSKQSGHSKSEGAKKDLGDSLNQVNNLKIELEESLTKAKIQMIDKFSKSRIGLLCFIEYSTGLFFTRSLTQYDMDINEYAKKLAMIAVKFTHQYSYLSFDTTIIPHLVRLFLSEISKSDQFVKKVWLEIQKFDEYNFHKNKDFYVNLLFSWGVGL